MFDFFLFIGLPYLAIASFVGGSIVRYKMKVFSYSSLSTQFLEDRWLAWASLPWHLGIIIVLLGHLLAFVFPAAWTILVSIPGFLITVEVIGLIGAFLCLFGLLIFLIRRFVDARLQAVTSFLDVAILLILFLQVSTGLAVALNHRWGAAWAPGALGPYLQGIFFLKPEVSVVRDMPPFVKLHIASAWVLFALFPFTRLIHVLSLPIHYFFRSPQKVIWNNSRSSVRFVQKIEATNERRLFLRAAIGVGAAMAFLSTGALDKFFRYFLKQDLTDAEESHLLSRKLQRLKQTAEERELELERMNNQTIFVARLSELSATKGKYFIDYQMRPALAFRDEKGFPIVISAKCTHLGCTVGQDVDAQGRILCPCHISFFDIKTGQPNLGAPAKSPLPHLGWVLKDNLGNQLLLQDPHGRREGTIDSLQLEASSLYIIKRFA